MLPLIDHLWISDFFSLLLKVDDFPKARLPKDISDADIAGFSQNKNPQEGREIAIHFLRQMNKFYKEIDFDSYWKERSAFYQSATDEISGILNSGDWLDMAESFYQHSFALYNVYPSLTLPPYMGFATNDEKQAFALLSAQTHQTLENKEMGFADTSKVMDIYIHELGHSLLNPSFKQLSDELFEQTAPAFTFIEEQMREQNYLSWKGVVNEYFTRSGEIIIRKMLGDTEAEDKLMEFHLQQKHFIYLPLFVDVFWKNYQQGHSYLSGMKTSLNKLKDQYNKYNKTDSEDMSQLSISGKVMDLKTESAIPFVNIGISGKNVGTISREDGSFDMIIKDYDSADSLSFSMVGYQPFSIAIKAINEDFLKVYLSEDIQILKEVSIKANEINEEVVLGRKKKTKTTRGQSNSTSYGTGMAYGIRINTEGLSYMLKEVNFHMRFNSTDSILFRINIQDIKNGLPDQTILSKELYMKSYKGQKWISKDFSNEKIIIDQDVIISYEVVKVWFSNKTYNNIFFTYGKGYEEGGQYMRESSFSPWKTSSDAFPIALYITGRVL
ncbi:hypothetical protein GCM10011506_04960 [Marivirga lumbricoides]|uniref:Carboxypeptidase-like regulatory domain-containing protein n=2 Tax=Marivirga lumbricoides TaxID=1046115 RepID=A0ABQ1LDQ8_9BACT|nr:hypothetical protein GCM10011506_04960 [Marivirga lumbricoides]